MKINLSAKGWFVVSVFVLLLTYVSAVVLVLVKSKYVFTSLEYVSEIWLYGQDKITILIISLALFMWAKSLAIRYNKYINLVASCTFGVYLFHEHILMRPFIWNTLFYCKVYQSQETIIWHSIMVSGVIFVFGVGIELIRKKIFDWVQTVFCM